MILTDDSRYLNECTFTIKSTPEEAPIPRFADVAESLSNAFHNNRAVYTFSSSKKALRIHAMSSDSDTLTLLLQLADGTASDPTFAHMETGASRTEVKRDGEGIGVTAHLLISSTSIKGRATNEYLAILEEVPGINVGVVSSALTSIIKSESELTFLHPETKTTKGYRPIINVEHNAKSNLSDYLGSGILAGVTFVEQQINEQLDDAGEIVEFEHKTLFKVPKTTGERALEVIQTISDKFRTKKNGLLRITIKDRNNRQKTVSIMSDTDARAAKIHSLNKKVSIDPAISQCQEELHLGLVQKMRNWLDERMEIHVSV